MIGEAGRGLLIVSVYIGGAQAIPVRGLPEHVKAGEVAQLVRDLAAYVASAGGDWEALAADRPGWAAESRFQR